MPKPNYQFDKRQRELKKAKQQEEKRLKKLQRDPSAPDDAEANPDAPAAPVQGDAS